MAIGSTDPLPLFICQRLSGPRGRACRLSAHSAALDFSASAVETRPGRTRKRVLGLLLALLLLPVPGPGIFSLRRTTRALPDRGRNIARPGQGNLNSMPHTGREFKSAHRTLYLT